MIPNINCQRGWMPLSAGHMTKLCASEVREKETQYLDKFSGKNVPVEDNAFVID